MTIDKAKNLFAQALEKEFEKVSRKFGGARRNEQLYPWNRRVQESWMIYKVRYGEQGEGQLTSEVFIWPKNSTRNIWLRETKRLKFDPHSG